MYQCGERRFSGIRFRMSEVQRRKANAAMQQSLAPDSASGYATISINLKCS